MEEKDFKTIIDEALNSKNIDYEKLSHLANVPKHYIIALVNSDIAKLPASPYVRGYIKKIAAILHLNQEELWQLHEQGLNHKQSGAFDKLPSNRFAIRRTNKKNIIISIIIILFFIYFIFSYKNLFGAPRLEIIFPNESLVVVTNPDFNLTGKINPKDKLTINNIEVLTDFNGNFQYLYTLQSGINTIEFKVKKLLGKEIIEVRQILYKPSGE